MRRRRQTVPWRKKWAPILVGALGIHYILVFTLLVVSGAAGRSGKNEVSFEDPEELFQDPEGAPEGSSPEGGVKERRPKPAVPDAGAGIGPRPPSRSGVANGVDGDRLRYSAVLMGLIWLKNHQNPDGMWSCDQFMVNCKKGACTSPGASSEYDVGVTSLALLAFLGKGQTHKHGKFKRSVKQALKALKGRQGGDGCFGPKGAEGRWMYNHALATLAFAEAYGMSNKSPLLQAPAQKGVDFLIDCQNPHLGWRYGRQADESDTSLTAWAVWALKAAKISGLHVPSESFHGALKWLDRVTDERTYRTGYRTKIGGPSRSGIVPEGFQEFEANTAAAVVCRAFILGGKATKRPEVIGGAMRVRQNPPKWDALEGSIDMMYWHFGAQAMFQLGGGYWRAWRNPMEWALVPTQKRTGCENGSWDPVGAWGGQGGRVYSTAINVLTLETDARYHR